MNGGIDIIPMFILDFDDTLFDTHRFVEDIYALFESIHIPRTISETSMQTCIVSGEGEQYGYSFEKHIDVLRAMNFDIDRTDILKKLHRLLADHDYIFKDTLSFLVSLQRYEFPIYILTDGQKEFKQKKYYSSNIPTYIDKLITVQGHKEIYIASIIDQYPNIFFINDNLQENHIIKKQFPKIHVITKYNPYHIQTNITPQIDIPIFDSLTEIETYIATCLY